MRVFKHEHGLLKNVYSLAHFYAELLKYKKTNANKSFSMDIGDIYPRLHDNTGHTPVGIVYFYQDTWCAKKIFTQKPQHHYDVGSYAEMVGIISQFVPTTMIDIRPIDVKLPNLSFLKGSITALPFPDKEVKSISSICVIEHVGLGRYGDPVDPYGSEKSARELVRVLAQNGNLYITVPVDETNKVYFNAHRAFTREYILSLFSTLKLEEEKYLYGNKLFDTYDPGKGFGTGFYHFTRI